MGGARILCEECNNNKELGLGFTAQKGCVGSGLGFIEKRREEKKNKIKALINITKNTVYLFGITLVELLLDH